MILTAPFSLTNRVGGIMAITRNFFTGRGTIPMENLNASRE